MKNRYVFLYVAVFCLGVLASEVALSQQIVDLDVVNGDLRVLGNVAYNKTGVGHATGDANGDGVPDLLIGAPGVLPDERRFDK